MCSVNIYVISQVSIVDSNEFITIYNSTPQIQTIFTGLSVINVNPVTDMSGGILTISCTPQSVNDYFFIQNTSYVTFDSIFPYSTIFTITNGSQNGNITISINNNQTVFTFSLSSMNTIGVDALFSTITFSNNDTIMNTDIRNCSLVISNNTCKYFITSQVYVVSILVLFQAHNSTSSSFSSSSSYSSKSNNTTRTGVTPNIPVIVGSILGVSVLVSGFLWGFGRSSSFCKNLFCSVKDTTNRMTKISNKKIESELSKIDPLQL